MTDISNSNGNQPAEEKDDLIIAIDPSTLTGQFIILILLVLVVYWHSRRRNRKLTEIAARLREELSNP
jgi:hypothetical protein